MTTKKTNPGSMNEEQALRNLLAQGTARFGAPPTAPVPAPAKKATVQDLGAKKAAQGGSLNFTSSPRMAVDAFVPPPVNDYSAHKPF